MKLLFVMLCFPIWTTVQGQQTPTLLRSVFAPATSLGAPLVATLPTAPASGNMLWMLLEYGIYGDYDYVPPDPSWNCTLGGRSGASAGGSVRALLCSHVVISGDGTRYSWTPTSNDGPGPASGLLFETSGTTGAQVAFNYLGQPSSTLNTPALTPTAIGSLFLAAATVGKFTAEWPAVNSSYNLVASKKRAADTTTPISTVISGFNYGQSLQMTALLTPGVFADPPVASPAAGSYLAPQTVSLNDSTRGVVVHYTLDGTLPTCASAAYASPMTFAATTQLNTIACAPGFTNSAVVFRIYVIGAGTLAGMALGVNADWHGYTMFPTDLLHTAIDTAPVDPNSAAKMSLLQGGARTIGHDWSSTHNVFGIPYVVVDSRMTAPVPYLPNATPADLVQSDTTWVPIPNSITIEQYPPACKITGDNHANVIDRYLGVVYEFWRFQHCPNAATPWQAYDMAAFSLTALTSVQRPYGYTSADAAGLSIVEALVRYDEAASGTIDHAIRFTANVAGAFFANGSGYGYFYPPAMHNAPSGNQAPNAANLIADGMRVRLKADYDISGFSGINQTILKAMKKYGLVLADRGNPFQFQGSPSPFWNDSDLAKLDRVPISAFEVVQSSSPLYYGAHGNYPLDPGSLSSKASRFPVTYRGSPLPVISSLVASPSTVSMGSCTTITALFSNAAYGFFDKAGVIKSGVPMNYCPTSIGKQTLTMTAQGTSLKGDDGFSDGSRVTRSVVVTVVASSGVPAKSSH